MQVRKLEFLLADAVESGADCIVTVGGIQSNHARATAVAASYLGLPCHLVLRNSRHVAGAACWSMLRAAPLRTTMYMHACKTVTIMYSKQVFFI
jgi:1-aminocyclopropane-1-carboxylate deaminase/D-cysteine desulfhydrase-like pyridoxal-dependent ACC family enzyme